MKNIKLLIPALIVIGSATLLSQSAFATNWYAPRCTSGALKNKVASNKFHCKATTSRVPSCPSGKTKKQKNIGKDKCESLPSEQIKTAECKVGTGNLQKNWKKNVKNGADNCTHKTKNKGVKPLKCSGSGYALVVDKSGKTDKCVKSTGSVVSTNISCNTGETHKTSGLDKCEKTTESKPIF